MIKKMIMAAVLATAAAATPAAAAVYSFSYQSGAGLLADTRLRDAIKVAHPQSSGGVARSVPHQRINLRGLLGVTSVALGTAIDGSLQNFCAAMQADCSGVGFAVVTSLAPLDDIVFTSASDIFATYFVSKRLSAPAARVPEPANWALWIAGFGVLGMMQRRRTLRMA